MQYIARRQFEAKVSDCFRLLPNPSPSPLATTSLSALLQGRTAAPQNGDDEWLRLKWAIAGRAKDKLEKAKAAAQSEVSGDLKAEVPVNAELVLANSDDQNSIVAMVKQTRYDQAPQDQVWAERED